MTEKQKAFLIQEGFKERTDEFGHTEWFKHYQGDLEFVCLGSGTMMIHSERELFGSLLLIEAIALKLDYYQNKLHDVSML